MGSQMFSEFVGTLGVSQKLFLRNEKLMSSIALLIIFLSSILSASNIFCIKPSISDISLKAGLLPATPPDTPEFANLLVTLKANIRLIAGLEWSFVVTICLSHLFFATSVILASGVTHCGENLSVKELLPRAVKSLKRAFVTWFYITLLSLGFSLSLLGFLLPMVLIFDLTFTTPTAFSITIFILVLVFKAYLDVVWNLAFVVSVLEEKSGIEALGKAAQLIKGSTRRGFLLNLFFQAFSLSILYVWHMSGTGAAIFSSENSQMVLMVILVNTTVCLFMMSVLMAYTVLYYECKETHGEALEMQGTTEFTEVPFFPTHHFRCVFALYSVCCCFVIIFLYLAI